MTVSSAFVISRRTESFCFSRRRICIGSREWVPPLKSLRPVSASRPESNPNDDETPGGFPPDVDGLRAMSRGLGNQMDLADLPADRDEFLADDGIACITEFGQRFRPPSVGGPLGSRVRSRSPRPRRSPRRTPTDGAEGTSRRPSALSARSSSSRRPPWSPGCPAHRLRSPVPGIPCETSCVSGLPNHQPPRGASEGPGARWSVFGPFGFACIACIADRLVNVSCYSDSTMPIGLFTEGAMCEVRHSDSVESAMVQKIIDVAGSSPASFAKAAENAVASAAETVRNLKWARVSELEMELEGKKVKSYRVTVRIYFDVER